MTTSFSPFSNLNRRRRRGQEQSFFSPSGVAPPSLGSPQPTFGGPAPTPSGFGGFQSLLPSGFQRGTSPGGFADQPFIMPQQDLFPGIGAPQGQTQGQTNNIFQDFLEEEPDIPFFGQLFSQQGGRDQFTPNQQAAFRNQRQQFTDRFLAQIFDQIQGGQLPTARFTDFIGDFDFGREFNQQFGPQTAQFAPRTRFLGR